MINGEILEVHLKWLTEDPANPHLNIFHYQLSTGTDFPVLAGIDAFGEAFYDTVLSVLRTCLSDSALFYEIEAVNLDAPDEFNTWAYETNNAGTITGEVLPQYASWGFIYNRTTRQTRNGYKRFFGIPEVTQNNGKPDDAALPVLNAVADALGSDLVVPFDEPFTGEWIFTPVIVRKTAQFTYSRVNLVSSVQFTRIGTQNSRK